MADNSKNGGQNLPGQQQNPFGGKPQGENKRSNLHGQDDSNKQEGGGGPQSNPTQAQVATPPGIEMPEMPNVELPKGGGSLQGIGEKFETNPVTGTGSFSVPINITPGRNGFGPSLGLNYDSGSGNSPYGIGWSVGVPSVSRKAGRQIPTYSEASTNLPVGGLGDEDAPFAENFGDVFLLSGAEDLIPAYNKVGTNWVADTYAPTGYSVTRYRPRTEGLFSRIEKWVRNNDGDIHWRSISKGNVHTVYGESASCRIVHPDDSSKVFQWMIERSWDDKGNVMLYEYKKENTDGIAPQLMHESHRLRDNNAFNQLYLKEIHYGNTEMYSPSDATFFDAGSTNNWLFTLLFDYGEHSEGNPLPSDTGTWDLRQDPYSSFKSGFELRTYRLCKRMLMYHQFSELNSGNISLVASTNLFYDENPVATRMEKVVHRKHLAGETDAYRLFPTDYDRNADMPPVEMQYSVAQVDSKLRNFNTEDLENLPGGVDGNKYTWNDLNGEGITGILTEAAGGWFYKRNYGDKRYYERADFTGNSEPELKLGALERVASKPHGASPQMLTDIDGDGRPEVVVRTPQLSGYYEQDADGEWKSFTAFLEQPNIDWSDPYLRMIDLNGDGRADILLTAEHGFRWYPSKGKKGYGEPLQSAGFFDDTYGPTHIHSITRPSAQRGSTPVEAEIYLADMTGDGMTDIVRIGNGAVSYWPNKGYGQFGARVNMTNAPQLDDSDQFDHERLRLADVDGSGTADLIYFGTDTVRWFLNQSGNSYALEATIDIFPKTDNLSSMNVLDLYGNGTSCLVWSSPLPGDIPFRVRYIELQSQKPYLLTEVRNNMGAVNRMHYSPSTKFYLKDRREGNPWVTKLPFPVQVVERMESFDEITNARFVSLYAYHHGYFDTYEREFRGFGMVEQWDTEHYDDFASQGLFEPGSNTLDEASHIPPVYTKTWFHTGWYEDANRITSHYQHEYFQGDNDAWELPETALPTGLTAKEEREAVRTLRGKPLRSEMYADDNTTKADKPYSISSTNYNIQLVQPSLENRHGSFLCTDAESLMYYYERIVDDPRTAHSMVLEQDAYGNPTKSATVAYPRRPKAGTTYDAEQNALHITYSEVDLAHDLSTDDRYRLGVPYQTEQYEIHGLSAGTFSGGGLPPFRPAALLSSIHAATPIAFEATPSGAAEKRLIGKQRAFFYNNAVSIAAPLGELKDRALMHHIETLAFTPGLVTTAYNNDGTTRVTSSMLTTEGGYIQDSEGYWMQTGVPDYRTGKFFLPKNVTDPFGGVTQFSYDAYNLTPDRIEDALGNVIAVGQIDYRVIAPARVTDPNGNRQEVEFDTRGMVIKTAIRGKSGSSEGDTLTEPTAESAYSLFNWLDQGKPNYSLARVREIHGDLSSPWQDSYTYSGGMGQTIMVKAQAEDGEAFLRNPDGSLQLDGQDDPILGNVTNRWVGNGRTIYNNKGLPVKTYEPYFSSTHEYEDETEVREYGVTPIMHYDSLSRLVSSEMPDGTFVRAAYGVWEQSDYDQNDTVIDSTWFSDRNSPSIAGAEPSDPDERAAWLAGKHYNTPRINHFDSMGRVYLSQDDYGTFDGTLTTHQYVNTKAEFDIQNNKVKVIDARNLETVFTPSMLGGSIYANSPDGGWRRGLSNTLGLPIFSWDQRGHLYRSTHDVLNRPKAAFVTKPGESEALVHLFVYGDDAGITNPENNNLRNQSIRVFDQSGVVQTEAFDFKGNPTGSERRFCTNYSSTVDWTDLLSHTHVDDIDTEADNLLESEIYTGSTTYDALNRPTLISLPDNSNVRPQYNKANFLDSMDAQLRGDTTWTNFVTNIDYDAQGQRQKIEYANGTQTAYTYEETTFRLLRLVTDRVSDSKVLQDLNYTFDPVGNITELKDDAQQDVYFQNAVVVPQFKYAYDALYRLTKSTGREHAGTTTQGAGGSADMPAINTIPHVNNATALRNYTQRFEYDVLGNIERLVHTATGGGFTRNYTYVSTHNRLVSTEQGGTTVTYSHDVHGNMESMPHLTSMQWDYQDQLCEVDLGGGGTAYYVYSGGERVRKVIKNGTNIKDRIYLGSNEVYRYTSGGSLQTERETLLLTNEREQLCQVDTLLVDAGTTLGSPTQELRWQYSNHLGSAALELDTDGLIISYEEYHPFGTSAYRSGRSAAEVSLKRYRYVGKEWDDETGLYYYGARYYAAWLCRFVSVDPLKDTYPQLSPYNYADNKPVNSVDIDGLQNPSSEKKAETLSTENKATVKSIQSYIDSEITSLNASIKSIEDKTSAKIEDARGYLEAIHGKAYDNQSDELKTQSTREEFIEGKIDEFRQKEYSSRPYDKYKARLQEFKTLKNFYDNHDFTNDSLLLGGVIRNEAGSSSSTSKEAVGYAYLNRTNGEVRQPKGAEISKYKNLSGAWKGVSSEGKQTFVKQLKQSIEAADTVLADSNRKANDPTKGATHWISPMADVFDSKGGENTHKRTIYGKVRYVPEWARPNTDPELKTLKTGPDAILNSDFKQIIPAGVGKDFLFYKGVK